MKEDDVEQRRKPYWNRIRKIVVALFGLGSVLVGVIAYLSANPEAIPNAIGYWTYLKALTQPAPSCSLEVWPKTLHGPGKVEVHWNAPEAINGEIDEIGSLPYPSGYAAGQISRSTTFVGTFWNAAWKRGQCDASVTVLPRSRDSFYPDYSLFAYGIPPLGVEAYDVILNTTTDEKWTVWAGSSALATCRLSASPQKLPNPGRVKLIWSATNAYSGKIDGFGILGGPSGNGTVYVAQTTTFVATFANADGIKTECSASVTVGTTSASSPPG